MKLQIIKSETKFISLREEWDELLINSTEDNPFLSHQWLQVWWEVYGKGQLYILACRQDISGKLMGVLPLYRFSSGRILPVTMLCFLGSKWVSSDFLGCIARRGSEGEVYDACHAALRQNSCAWDVIEMRDIDEQSHFCHCLTGAGVSGLHIRRDPANRCPFITLPDSWERLVSGLSSKRRKRIGYYRRSLARQGEVLLEQVVESADLPAALEDLIRLRQDRLSQKGLSQAVSMDDYRRFHSQLLSMFLDTGRLRLYFLTVDGSRVAFLYLYAGRKGIYFYQTGFDSSWKKHSVGSVLLGMVIEKSIEEGFEVFEFLRGDERYKYEWRVSGERTLVDLIIIGSSSAAKLWQGRRFILSFARSLLRPAARRWSQFCHCKGK